MSDTGSLAITRGVWGVVMVRSVFSWIAVAVLILSACAQSPKQLDLEEGAITALFVAVEPSADAFTVVDKRLDETATAAAFFGLVGAVVNSEINSSQDQKIADQWREAASAIDVGAKVKASLDATLTARSFAIAADEDAASHVLTLTIKEWGLIRESRETTALRAFINTRIDLRDERGRTIWTGYKNKVNDRSFEDRDQITDAVFTGDIGVVAKDLGESIAYELLYR